MDILGRYFGGFVFLLGRKDVSIEDHLENLAELSLMAFVLQRRNGTKFMPNQNIRATHTMGRACCASACMLSIRNTNGTLEIAQLLLELGDRWRECMFDYLMFEASLLTSVVVIVVVRVQASR